MKNEFVGPTQAEIEKMQKRAEKQDRKFKKRIKKLLKKQRNCQTI